MSYYKNSPKSRLLHYAINATTWHIFLARPRAHERRWKNICADLSMAPRPQKKRLQHFPCNRPLSFINHSNSLRSFFLACYSRYVISDVIFHLMDFQDILYKVSVLLDFHVIYVL